MASFFGGIKNMLGGKTKVLIVKKSVYAINALFGRVFHTPCPHINQIKPRDMPLYTRPHHTDRVAPTTTTRTTGHHYPHYSTQHQLKI